MIDICMAAFVNYELLKLQLDHWDWIEGDFNLLICDNTPIQYRKSGWLGWHHKYKTEVFNQEFSGIDGTRHGESLNLLVRKAKTPIIGICDTDFFWLKQDILSDVERLFAEGIQCLGAELWYDDFDVVNQRYPERAGWLAPCVFGMFITRELALSDTFATTPEEGKELKETGWRIREKLIKNKIPCHTYRAFIYPQQPDQKICYFGTPEEPIGVHLLKGSSERWNSVTESYKNYVQKNTNTSPTLPC